MAIHKSYLTDVAVMAIRVRSDANQLYITDEILGITYEIFKLEKYQAVSQPLPDFSNWYVAS